MDNDPAKRYSIRQRVILLLSSNRFESFLIFLLFLYVLVVMVQVCMDELFPPGSSMMTYQNMLSTTEITLLALFLLEILNNLYAYGWNYYLRDKVMILETFTIFFSLAVLIWQTISSQVALSFPLQLLNGAFRLTRLFLVNQKIQQCKDLSNSQQSNKQMSPLLRSIEIMNIVLASLKEHRESLRHIYNMRWCVEIVSKQKLYEPVAQVSKTEAKGIMGTEKLQVLEKDEVLDDSQLAFRQYCLAPKDELAALRLNTMQVPYVLEEFLEQKGLLIEFEIFDYYELSQEEGLAYMFTYLVKKEGLDESLATSQRKAFEFMGRIEQGYLDNPYHNAIHASDVLQTLYCFYHRMNIPLQKMNLTALLVAVAIHDFEHPGTNNIYQTASRNAFALKYNDQSVLEMHHLSASFDILAEPQFNIFANLPIDTFREVRQTIIECVFATDMSTHFLDLKNLQKRLDQAEFSLSNPQDLKICISHMVHAADISHSLKPWALTEQWCLRVQEEFFNQGDLERHYGREVSPGMDRFSVNVSVNQVQFLDIFVMPTFETVARYLPAIQVLLPNIMKNRERWESLKEFYQKELEQMEESDDDNEQEEESDSED